MSAWRSIETVPEGTEVLMCACPEGPGNIGLWKYGLGQYHSPLGSRRILFDWPWMFTPTHWMPLPSPSVTASEGEENA